MKNLAQFALLLLAAAFTGAAAGAQTSRIPKANEAPFLEANDIAMSKMMDGMAVKPTGDVDFDFSAMMIPITRARSRWRKRNCAGGATSNSAASPRRS